MFLKNRTTCKIIGILCLAICGGASMYRLVPSPLAYSSYTPKKALASPMQVQYTATSPLTIVKHTLASTNPSMAELMGKHKVITFIAGGVACMILYMISSKEIAQIREEAHDTEPRLVANRSPHSVNPPPITHLQLYHANSNHHNDHDEISNDDNKEEETPISQLSDDGPQQYGDTSNNSSAVSSTNSTPSLNAASIGPPTEHNSNQQGTSDTPEESLLHHLMGTVLSVGGLI